MAVALTSNPILNLSCFVAFEVNRVIIRPLKSMLADFYPPQDISEDDVTLVNDFKNLNLK